MGRLKPSYFNQDRVSKHLLVAVFIVISFSSFRKISAIRIFEELEPWTYLGKADGLTYFATIGNPVDWTIAKEACNSVQLNLATIRTEAQHEVILKAFREYPKFQTSFRNDSTDVYKYFWTAAREVRESREMMRWDDTNTEPDENVFKDWRSLSEVVQSPYTYCAAFIASPDANVRFPMTITKCSELLPGILCERKG